MTEAVGGKIQETQIGRYKSTRGINYDSIPWKLWEKSKKLFWDPADLDFTQDAIDWQEMPETARTMVALSARGFMVGEEAVTLDIIPLLRCMSDLGRLEDTMYLSMFAMEEAKHTDMFRRWFDAVGLDPASLDDFVLARNEAMRGSDGRSRPRAVRWRAHQGHAAPGLRSIARGDPGRDAGLQPARGGRGGDQRVPALGRDVPQARQAPRSRRRG